MYPSVLKVCSLAIRCGIYNSFPPHLSCFASPRSVILAMQKRMRQLDQSSSDPMLACFRANEVLSYRLHRIDLNHDQNLPSSRSMDTGLPSRLRSR